LIKEPLNLAELKKIAALVGGPEELVAPKRRAEAAGKTGEALFKWLAEDGAHLRRPIVLVGGKATLGFNAVAQTALAKLLSGRASA